MIKKRDIWLACIVIAVSLILLGILKFANQESGTQIEIRVNGQTYGIYDLSRNQEITVETEYGHNLVVIADGQAYMSEADCPDGYCKNQGKISHENETIVCLPHKLVVEVQVTKDSVANANVNKNENTDAKQSGESESETSFDAISQ